MLQIVMNRAIMRRLLVDMACKLVFDVVIGWLLKGLIIDSNVAVAILVPVFWPLR